MDGRHERGLVPRAELGAAEIGTEPSVEALDEIAEARSLSGVLVHGHFISVLIIWAHWELGHTGCMTVPDPLALENQVCFALAVAARSVVGLYRPLLEPLGLTHPQYLVMLTLWQHATRSIKELGEALQLDPATVSPLVKRLETDGLVTRVRSPDDERVLIVGLTEEGVALREQAMLVPGAVVERLRIGTAELEGLRDVLIRFITASNAATRQ